jgi:ADP-ribose pyrophosphatase
VTDLKRISRDVLYRGKIIDLVVDQVEYPDGKRGVREVVRHPGGAVTVPLLDDGRVILVKQLRYPFGEEVLELPAGKLDPGEDPAAAAARELTEETGWIAGKLEKLTSILTSPGFCDEILHIYKATQLHESPSGHRRETGEFSMTLRMVPFAQARAMAVRGEIRDAKSIIGLLLAGDAGEPHS